MTIVLGLVATPQGLYVLLSKLPSATFEARVPSTTILHCLLIHSVTVVYRTRFTSPLGILLVSGSMLTLLQMVCSLPPPGETPLRADLQSRISRSFHPRIFKNRPKDEEEK